MIDPITFVFRFLFDYWWFLFPFLFLSIWWAKFVGDRKSMFRRKFSWSFLEILFPSGITRTPKAMEEVFNALHAIAVDPKIAWTWWNKNIVGFSPKSYCFIIIAHNGKLRFFIRFPSELKDFIKTRFYMHYPDIKFLETENPLIILPPSSPNSLFDLETFGASLAKEDGYPIKTYVEIEKLPEEQQIDPITTFSEGAQQISDKEWVVFQIFILPVKGDDPENGKKWTQRGQKLVNKLIGKEESKERSIWDEAAEFTKNLLLAPFKAPEWKTEEKKEKEFNIQKLTPGERKILESIQNKITKLGFLCSIRASYIAHQNIFVSKRGPALALINSVFKGFNSEDLNSFVLVPLTKKWGKEKFLSLENLDIFILKNSEFFSFRTAYRPPFISFVLNSEELASLFHPPMKFVPHPGIERIPVREISPPSEIPFAEL